MLRRPPRRTTSEEVDAPWVYGAALQAADSEASALDAAVAAFGVTRGSRLKGEERRRATMARAVRIALMVSPCPALAALPAQEREAIGLARIVGLKVDEIAALVECEAREVKRRMLSGLRRLAADPVASA